MIIVRWQVFLELYNTMQGSFILYFVYRLILASCI